MPELEFKPLNLNVFKAKYVDQEVEEQWMEIVLETIEIPVESSPRSLPKSKNKREVRLK